MKNWMILKIITDLRAELLHVQSAHSGARVWILYRAWIFSGLLLATSEVATFTVVPVQAYPLDSFAESIIWTNESDSRCRNKCQI